MHKRIVCIDLGERAVDEPLQGILDMLRFAGLIEESANFPRLIKYITPNLTKGEMDVARWRSFGYKAWLTGPG